MGDRYSCTTCAATVARDCKCDSMSGADLTLGGGGTVYTLTPNTEDGRAWVADNLPADALTFGRGVAIEWRFVDDIVDGAMGDGLTVARSDSGR